MRVIRNGMLLGLGFLLLATVARAEGAVQPGPPDESPASGTGSAAGFVRAASDADASRALPAVTTRTAPDSLVAPDSALTEPRPAQSKDLSIMPSARQPLTQPGCDICITGSGSVQWTGTTGSYRVDGIDNYNASGISGPLDLRVSLSSALPVYGQTIYAYTLSDATSLNSLLARYHYSNVTSGTVNFYPSSIPAGQYYMFLFLRENLGGTWHYDDFMLMQKMASCDGVYCSTPSTCVEDAYTMCLVKGRYKVTSHWLNQYATPPSAANLEKTKLTDNVGAFWIADANTYEYVVRFNTATTNGKIWVNVSTFTSVEFWVSVTDTVSGQTKEYHSPAGTDAFNTVNIWDPYYFVYP